KNPAVSLLLCLRHRAQTLATVISLHEQAGVAHLDIKPSNIVVKPVMEGDKELDFYAVKLVDFGSAQVMSVRPIQQAADFWYTLLAFSGTLPRFLSSRCTL
ncbi:unnamed protein product, partial [Hapterophycus canaliculatus]